jgi:hypothetical protein
MSNLMHHFLNELSSKDFDDTINRIVEQIEERIDPEPEELKLLEAFEQFIEKKKILESHIRAVITKKQARMTGNKLSDLYDREPTFVGTQKMFR